MSEGNGLPPGWTLARLEEAADVIMGQSPSSSTYNEEGEGLPFFQGKAEFTDLFPVVRKWCSAPTKVAEPDDILLSVRAPVGPTNLARSKCCIGRGLCAIRACSKVETRYILYAMRAFASDLSKRATGSTFEAVSGGVVRAFQVPVAPTNEQRRIVAGIEEQFTRLDAGVCALERARANLKRYRASVLKAAVEGRLTEDWRKENPDTESGSALLERILEERRTRWEKNQLAKYAEKEQNPPKNWRSKYKEPAAPDVTGLPELPEGWVWASLPQIGQFDRGKSKHRPRNAPHLYGGPYPFVQTGDVRHAGTFIKEYKQTYSEAGLLQSKLWLAGTLCITIAANIAETAILSFDACFPDSVVGFIAPEGYVSVRYVEIYLRTIRERLETYAPATAQKNINIETLKMVAVALPPLAEQEEIVAEVERRLSVIEEVEAGIAAGLKRAARLRQSILKRAFEGKLVPQDPTDEPASVLLERVEEQRAAQEKPRKNPRRRKRAGSTAGRERMNGGEQPGLF